MKTFKIEFDLRDWKQGNELLQRLGHTEQFQMTQSTELELEEWQEEDLRDECEALDLKFELEELED